MKKILLGALLLFTTFAQAVTADDVSTKTKKALDSAAEYTTEQKEDFQKKMEANLESLKSKITELKNKAAAAQGHVQKKSEKNIAQLEKKQKELQIKLEKLKNSSGRAWSKMKVGLSAAWDKTKTTFTEVQKELQ